MWEDLVSGDRVVFNDEGFIQHNFNEFLIQLIAQIIVQFFGRLNEFGMIGDLDLLVTQTAGHDAVGFFDGHMADFHEIVTNGAINSEIENQPVNTL
jgi:hypothetical protein